MRLLVRNCLIALAFGFLASSASADWNIVYLDPGVGDGSSALAVNGGHQGGDVAGHAAIWSGSAASWIDLQPEGVQFSYVTGISGNQQMGTVLTDGSLYRAGLWNGSAATYIDLTPDSLSEADGTDTDGFQQVGWGKQGLTRQACLWSGTKASYVPLDAPGGGDTWAYAVHDGKQVGTAMIGSQEVACMWSSTTASFLNLNPIGASSSDGSAIYGNTQGGSAKFDGTWEPVIWGGSAESCIRLAPGLNGDVSDIYDNYQVGGLYLDSDNHASLWTGSTASWFDLSSLLPDNYSYSSATNIWGDGTNLYISGQAKNDDTNRMEAIMWVQSVPEPAITSIMLFGLVGLAIKKRIRKS